MEIPEIDFVISITSTSLARKLLNLTKGGEDKKIFSKQIKP